MKNQPNKISNLFDIKNKIALVTGGSRGIGFMIAKAYVENGAKVYITSRTATECQKAADDYPRSGTV